MSNQASAAQALQANEEHVQHVPAHNRSGSVRGASLHDEDQKRLSAFKALKQEVPKDNCNLPIFLYRIDLISTETLSAVRAAAHQANCTHHQTLEIECARVNVEWEEGFPTLPDGSALWGKWDFEDQTIHQCFLEYLELSKHVGMRSINDLAMLGESSQLVGRDRLYEAFVCYYWDDRARAFDLYERIRSRRLREKRILSTNDRHFLQTESLIESLYTKYFNKLDEETGEPIWIEDLTPKDAVKALETLVKIQKDSLGIHTGPASKQNQGEDDFALDSPDQIRGAMQDITTRTKRNDVGVEDDVLALLREDSEAAEAAQSLVVRLNSRRNHDRDPASGASSGGIQNGANDGISAEDERRFEEQAARKSNSEPSNSDPSE